ncbi:MAG: RIP metalloprotease RseP [Planctomycetota bacterium]
MSLSVLFYAVQVILGIGLVIFVHELGHFLAARWCGARVEVFSLGFGPRLFGWRRGDTMFQVAAVPLGGYVRVAGEYGDGAEAEPGTLLSLNVPQRFLYYSGGVIMNVLFALVVLPLVMFAGYPSAAPIIGSPTPGQPAWAAGVPAGSRVVEVAGEEILDFQRLVTAIAVNGKDPISVVVQPPGEDSALQTFELIPAYDPEVGVYRIGLPRGFDPDRALEVQPDSAAARAGLATGDRLVRLVGQPEGLAFERQLARALTSKDPLTLEVLGADGASRTVTVEPKVETLKDTRRIGVGAIANRVQAVRTTGVTGGLCEALDVRPGDVIVSLLGSEPYRLSDLEDALGAIRPGEILSMRVQRDGNLVELEAEVPAGVQPVRLFEDVALETNSNTTRVSVTPGSAAEDAGLVDGDRIVSIDGTGIETWEALLEAVQKATASGRSLDLVVERATEPATYAERITGAPAENETLALTGTPVEVPRFGVLVSQASITLKAKDLGEAIALGTSETGRWLVGIWMQLKKMIFSDEISTKNLGGIITISFISYETASQGLASLFFFLAVLSINLAIINLFPIPILDGGHLLFLLIEAVKGSPVSERTFGYSQVVGLVMIMSLMVYVTYQDIVRWFLPS